jgi:hemoglobin
MNPMTAVPDLVAQSRMEADIGRLVRAFYGRARRDAQLGPIFNAAVEDWDEHMERLTDFWSSVMLSSGRYKGNPFAVHRPLPMRPELFDVWLRLWRETTAEIFEPEVAAQFDVRADRIAESLKAGLFFRRDSMK